MRQFTLHLCLFWLAISTGRAQFVGFTETAESMNVNYSFEQPSDFGMGMTFYDFTQDGLDDVTFGGLPGQSLHFYRSDGTSMDKLILPGLVNDTDAKSLIWVDYDNDGDPDLSVTHLGGRVRLFRNQGDLTFEDVSNAAGLDSTVLYSYGSCWCDYDRDGHLDLYVTNRNGFQPGRSDNQLYRNLGDGTFENVTVFANAADGQGLGFGCTFFDYDKDGWPDLYIANDKAYTANTLLRNQGNGKFTNVSDPNTTGIMMDGMGVAPGDFDGNGYEDLYITNTAQSSPDFGGNVFLRNLGNGSFTDIADSLNMRVYSTGWGANMADLNNDGLLDLYVANEGIQLSQRINRIFINRGDGTFTEDTLSNVYTTYNRSFGSATGDLNNDGQVDVIVMNSAGDKVSIWRNDGNDNHWIKVHLEGTVSNRDGIGSWIELYTAGEVQRRYTRAGSSYGSQSSGHYHFGLGTTATVDSIVVRWPSDLVNVFRALPADSTYYFLESEDTSTQVQDTTVTSSFELIGNSGSLQLYPNPTSGLFRLTVQHSTPAGELTLYDLEGALLMSLAFSDLKALESEVMDIRSYPTGTYILQWKIGQKNWSVPIVKQ